MAPTIPILEFPGIDHGADVEDAQAVADIGVVGPASVIQTFTAVIGGDHDKPVLIREGGAGSDCFQDLANPRVRGSCRGAIDG